MNGGIVTEDYPDGFGGTTGISRVDNEAKLIRKARNQRYRKRHKMEIQENDRTRHSGEQYNSQRREEYTPSSAKPFVGVDGEGRNTADGRHVYFMLRAGNEVLWPRDGEERLRSRDILEFLSSLPSENTYVAFFFDYDVTKILEDFPWTKLEKLVHKERRVRKIGGWFPVDWMDYEIDWMPKKEFKVRKKGGKWVVISDVGTLFQSAFAKVIELWNIGTVAQREQIVEGKNQRANFDQVTDGYVDEYNHLECILLAQLMEQFREVCVNLGYIPRKWQGPGILAESVMAHYGIPKSEDVEILQDSSEYSPASFGRYAYYGPQFETTVVGPSDSPTVQFDINSAFPSVMRDLPCLVHGKWTRVSGKREIDNDELSICFADFRWTRQGKRFMVGTLPIRRRDGSIHFPWTGKGWYWSFELRGAIHQQITVYDSWIYTKQCECRPFEFVNELYQERLKLGKSSKGLVLKLILNSMYGKLVQSIGTPKYSNPIWGSFITASTRTLIARAIHSLPCCKSADKRMPCGYDVFMVASDAIYTRDYDSFDSAALRQSKELGDWDKEIHEHGLFIIQPGVYFDRDGDSDKITYKTRGIPKRVVVQYKDSFLAGYEAILRTHDVRSGDVHLPFRTFIGIRQALQRRNTKLLAQFVEYHDPETGQLGRRTSMEWTTKRQPNPLPEDYSANRGIRTVPYWNTWNNVPEGTPIQTIPYSRDIGGLLANQALRLDFDDQPDWIRTE